MKKSLIIAVLCFLFLSQVARVSANSVNVSKEVERVETIGNTVTTYYSDGSKNVVVTTSLTSNVGMSVGTAEVIGVPLTSPLPLIRTILEILQEIVDGISSPVGVGCGLLAFRIWVLIKGLRRNRPKYYDNVS